MVADGASVSIERFGASAPGTTILEKFGYAPENIASRAQALLERRQRALRRHDMAKSNLHELSDARSASDRLSLARPDPGLAS